MVLYRFYNNNSVDYVKPIALQQVKRSSHKPYGSHACWLACHFNIVASYNCHSIIFSFYVYSLSKKVSKNLSLEMTDLRLDLSPVRLGRFNYTLTRSPVSLFKVQHVNKNIEQLISACYSTSKVCTYLCLGSLKHQDLVIR